MPGESLNGKSKFHQSDKERLQCKCDEVGDDASMWVTGRRAFHEREQQC